MPIKRLRQKMSSPPSSSETRAFQQLDERIQHWIWSQGWTSLRAVQEYAIPPLIAGDKDVILAAATSAGKTEAAFFPLLTRLVKPENNGGFILSISPLKALINDQTQRLTPICELMDFPVVGWHGDISATPKQKFLKNPSGILIITPESLESLFVNKGTRIPELAGKACCVVIDELHSFIGTERGKQVQSLLHRLERAAGRTIPRVGLSATLGNMMLAAEYLRPGQSAGVNIIDGASEGYELKLIVKGYCDNWALAPKEAPTATDNSTDDDLEKQDEAEDFGAASGAIADYLYRNLRGSNNLIFPNSRSKVEYYADQLRRRCEREHVLNEFWAHHGSLSRDLREESEAALKGGVTAATAVCTTTLELGIDIGNVQSVAQIGPPPSVASLRQRLGRSGRRAGEPAILRCLVIESKLGSKSTFSDQIREGLVQTTAMVRLLIERWVEPPQPECVHASTLVQQILSVIAQRGGVTAAELWTTLIASKVFRELQPSDFTGLLHTLGRHDLIVQDSSGALLAGTLGEKLINQYEFYSAFTTSDEFRISAEGRILGSLPIERPLTPGQRIIFGGRRWKVLDVDTSGKVIYVISDRGGAPPAFDGLGGIVHDRVRQEMRRVLSEETLAPFLDPQGSTFLAEARDWFREADLAGRRLLLDGNSILILGWRGDVVHDALALLLTARGLSSSNEGLAIRVSSADQGRVNTVLQEIATGPDPTLFDLGLKPEHAIREKWDWALPDDLRLRSFASKNLDLHGARELAQNLLARNPKLASLDGG